MSAIDAVRGHPVPDPEIADYDSNDYDYRTYWSGRAYEQRAEASVLRRLCRRMGRCEWLVDLGGGYGRNLVHYRDLAEHVVLVDYSVNNLEHASEMFGWDVLAERLHLVRADVHALPFHDSAFAHAVAVRLLHHLPDADVALGEMLRTVRGQAVLDVPIKHHVLARARAALGGTAVDLRGPTPQVNGHSEYPFHAFQLRAIRQRIAELGWRCVSTTSVNNFRRWDQVVPPAITYLLNPTVHALDLLTQRAGRGWWGPNQFLHATRPAAAPDSTAGGGLAERMRCPSCHSELDWAADHASCTSCRLRYPRNGAYWDFTLPTARERRSPPKPGTDPAAPLKGGG